MISDKKREYWRRYKDTAKGRAARDRQARSPARAAYRVVWVARRKAMLDQIKLERGCIDCGYRAHPAALDFDHRDPATKSFVISGSPTAARQRVLDEIAKCDVRCANCHRIRTTVERHYLGHEMRVMPDQPTLFDR